MPVYEIMWKSILQPDGPQMTIWHMRITCWMTNTTNPHSEHVILTAFPTTTMVARRSLMLRYTYIACRVGHNLDIICVVFMMVAIDVYQCHREILSHSSLCFYYNSERHDVLLIAIEPQKLTHIRNCPPPPTSQ